MPVPPAPATPTDIIWPDWANSIDNWRQQDAEWLRNRGVQIFDTAANRTSLMGTPPMTGIMSILQTGSLVGGPDYWTGSAWMSVRYPNLSVITDGTGSTTLRFQSNAGTPAGTGVQLMSDGSINVAKEFVGTGGVGTTLDNTGLTMKIGADTAKLATDANGFTMDSPLSITGGLTTSGPATLNSLTVTGTVNFPGSTTLGAVSAASVAATGAVTGATVTGGDVILGSAPPYGTIKHRSGGTAEFDVGSDSTVRVLGVSLAVGNATTLTPTTFAGTTQFNGQATFALPPRVSQATKDPNIQEAMIIMVQGNVAPTQNPPDGTIYFTY